MQADILDAVATWLSDELPVPVYYPDLPRSLVAAPPRTKMLVITPGGSVSSGGDLSWVKLTRARADLRCYGETQYEAMKVYRMAAEMLKGLMPRVVAVGPSGEEVGVKLFNATLSNGPLTLTDPDTKEHVVYGTWGVAGHETEIGDVPVDHGPTLIFKPADETNLTTDFTNDDELRFEVEEGSRYSGRLQLWISGDNDTGFANLTWDVPTDVEMIYGQPANEWFTLPGEIPFIISSDGYLYTFEFTIDATLAGGEVVFQFRCPDGNTSGGVTVKAGSFIELFRVS